MLNQETQERKLFKSPPCQMCNGSGLISKTIFDRHHRDHIIFITCDCMPKFPEGFARDFLKKVYNTLKEKGLTENLEKELFKEK